MEAVYHLDSWYDANRDLFDPPVCNKLMHKKQMSVMYVGGPNTRTDFHLDQGSEFFWMARGNMELPTIQQGKLKVVKIKEGQVYLCPSRVPHSPQRPETGSLGLVIERERYMEADPPEVDGLRWYTDFNNPNEILWEKFFHCGDLGRDLVPVVKEFKASEEFKTSKPGNNVMTDDTRPFVQDMETVVPDPFDLDEWLAKHSKMLDMGLGISLFPTTHPDNEFSVMIFGGGTNGATHEAAAWGGDTWIFQLKGAAAVALDGADATNSQQLLERWGGVVPPDTPYTVKRAPNSISMVITQDPTGNKPKDSKEDAGEEEGGASKKARKA
jgi:3-hydroxyanthranilate 3,4-dioxygenase